MEKIFVRKIKAPGVYSTCIIGEEIRIANREIYKTSDKIIIAFLQNDPEIEEYDTSENSQLTKKINENKDKIPGIFKNIKLQMKKRGRPKKDIIYIKPVK